MSNILKSYWSRQFTQYQINENQFEIPNFDHPLMSQHWGVTNFIDDDGQFSLGVINARESDFSNCKLVSLRLALTKLEYCNLIKQGFGDELEQLLPFLARHGHHYVGLIYEDKKLIAASTLGASYPYGLMLNGVIDKEYRGQNRSRDLIEMNHSMAIALGLKKMMFWTKYPALLRYCDEIYKYKIITLKMKCSI